ncbi:methyltransferase [Chromobacterium paludis]|uniref:Methyltransferase domain-containing protein n=1 Tax=Chromobacterium paludis TaxID=2605945 RepID=A0A5C1DCW1_9NEIS|nr:methyltransferase [Chromobacterium paludis]QEL54460.1 methyltransferase domain-containing protein [Chromobacterium paludis]
MADSSRVEFWEQRYQEGVTPWEGASLPEPARRFFGALPAGRILLPGCGSAGDLPGLAALGHALLGIDFSATAIEKARQQWPALADKLQLADFFQLDVPAFDAMFERAFLCALPREMRGRYAEQAARLIARGGVLAGVFFLSEGMRGPPFPIQDEELRDLLHPWFELEQAEPVPEGLPVFAGRECWMVWRRRLFDLDQVCGT